MLAYLKGVVVSQEAKGRIILDVQGVGYEVWIPAPAAASLAVGGTFEFWIYSHIKEAEFSLYGFFHEKEREIFRTLLSINGVGPKLALSLLSSGSAAKLIQWIESEDIEALCRLHKVGKKTAKQIVLSLKGKWQASTEVIQKDPEVLKREQEMTSALLRLGFRSQEIKQALSQMENPKTVQEGIKQALALLRQG